MPATGHIIVVDDDADIRETLVEMLEDHGCSAIGAENGQVALDALERMPPDDPCLILLDVMMPVMDGRAFREEQLKRQDLAKIPVVVISAFDEIEEMKADGYLKKPVEFDDVLRAARQFCSC
ncbi:MAG TPA: response regulator [Polyangiaceae bacterium]|jgi:CheY-like chemotaxis protein|nr:response regulator [Polyangiaceae bacterium]